MKTRIEKDKLGELEIPQNAFWGIHTQRALNNFNLSDKSNNLNLVKAMALTKKACALTNLDLKYIDTSIANPIIEACEDIISGFYDDQFRIDYLQGGAGTSLNMNLNEVIANVALEKIGFNKGDYFNIHPIEHVNLHQSTNDVYPTALKIACIYALKKLSDNAALLQGALQNKEQEFAKILIIGRTEMQDAVPITLGAQFSSFAEAISRDRWRTFKCEERLRIVNIGGTAVGTGLTAPRNYIFLVIEKLRELSGLGIARAETLLDATANVDVFSEVSGILNSAAVNLIKICGDLRLLHFTGEIELEAKQTGSSIMPGKINPVILESIISCAIKVSANDKIINDCASRGTLQINEFLPLIAESILDSIQILSNAFFTLSNHINTIKANEEVCANKFESNISIITAFLPILGYNECENIISEFSKVSGISFKNYLKKYLSEEIVEKTLSPENIMALGYRKAK